MSNNRLRNIQLLQILGILFRQRNLVCAQQIINIMLLVNPNNWTRDIRLGVQPSKSDLGVCSIVPFRQFAHAGGDSFLSFLDVFGGAAGDADTERVGRGADGLACSRQDTASWSSRVCEKILKNIRCRIAGQRNLPKGDHGMTATPVS